MRYTGSRLVAIGVMGLVLLAGCGGGDEASSTSTLPTTSIAPEVTTTTAAAPVTTTRPAPTQTTAAPAVTVDCPSIIFDNNGENTAYGVTATSLSCDDADAFIQKVRRTLTAVALPRPTSKASVACGRARRTSGCRRPTTGAPQGRRR